MSDFIGLGIGKGFGWLDGVGLEKGGISIDSRRIHMDEYIILGVFNHFIFVVIFANVMRYFSSTCAYISNIIY